MLSMPGTHAFDAYVQGGKSRTIVLTFPANGVTCVGLERALWMKSAFIVAGPH